LIRIDYGNFYSLHSIEIYGNFCGTYFTKLTTLDNKLLRTLQNKPYDARY